VTDTVTKTKTHSTVVTTTPSTTVTIPTTFTDTATQTATATFYAQCATTNFADHGPNGELSGPDLPADVVVVKTTTNDAYSCCVASINNSDCSFGGLAPRQIPNNCVLAEEPICNTLTTHFYGIHEDAGTGFPFQFFNGNCGQINVYDN
jgi:hypothetical protein